jgi:hypothetical protein
MLNKKILAASIAAAFSFNASAVVDLDASPVVPAVYAAETVAASTQTAGDAFEIAGTGNVIDVDATVGFGFTATTSYYIRYDLTNAVFETALTTADLASADLTGEVVTLAQGGAEDESFVIFEIVDADEVTEASDTFTLTNDDLALTGTGSASVQMRVFANAPDAVNETGALVTKSGTIVNQVSAYKSVFTTNNPVADVDDGFTDFLNDETEANVGSVELELQTALSADDGLVVARADLLTDATSKLVVTGDFSNALTSGNGAVTIDTASDCSNAGDALTVNDAGTTATLTNITPIADDTPLFVCLEPDPATTIAATDAYSATFDITAGANGQLADQTGSLGMITRNGTTLDFPFITTFSSYNQRILMTNNSSTATDYSCTFTPEAGVTYVAGSGASGTIPGNTTVSVRTVDLVTLTGGTRIAARCTLLSQSTNIDAATTIVNLSDKSTDTVVIN